MITPEISNTSLSSSNSLRIAALGVGMQGEYGAVTGIARDFGVSRPTVYEKTKRGQAALEEAFGEPKGGKVWATVTVDEARLRRAIISACVEGPNSMRDVQALGEAFYGVHVGYGKVFEILQEAMEFIGLHSMLKRTGSEQAGKLKDIADRMATLGGKKVHSLPTQRIGSLTPPAPDRQIQPFPAQRTGLYSGPKCKA